MGVSVGMEKSFYLLDYSFETQRFLILILNSQKVIGSNFNKESMKEINDRCQVGSLSIKGQRTALLHI